MLTSIDADPSSLHSTLTNISEGIEAPLNQLSDLLEQSFPIFSSVLQNPPPAEADRLTKLIARTRCLLSSLVTKHVATVGSSLQKHA